MNPRLIFSFIAFLSVRDLAQATAPEPTWWSNGVIDSSSSNPTDNWAMANAGQLKNIATKARAHLDSVLGTVQSDWDAAYAPDVCPLPFSTTANPDNFSPVNVGQLKFVSAGFYRLLYSKLPTYDVPARLQALGISPTAISGSGPYFPWSPTTGPGENYDAVTIGQLKMMFSFDLVGFQGVPWQDTDGDGVNDRWEAYYFGSLAASNGTDDHNGNGIPDGVEIALGMDPKDLNSSITSSALGLRIHVP